MPESRSKISSGLLMYRIKNRLLEIFLVHPGGPYFAKKDDGFWGIPKGEVNDGEDLFVAAKREFREETGINPEPKDSSFIPLGEAKMKSGKVVHCWAFQGDWSGLLISNYFSMQFPPNSGKWKKFPEVDKAQFFTPEKIRIKMTLAQQVFVERLEEKLKFSSFSTEA